MRLLQKLWNFIRWDLIGVSAVIYLVFRVAGGTAGEAFFMVALAWVGAYGEHYCFKYGQYKRRKRLLEEQHQKYAHHPR